MTDKNNLGAFDRFRLVAAVLVIAIHTSPLWSVNETCNFLLTGVFARVAVPFFFAMTGYFTDFKSSARIGNLTVKTLAMYAAAIVIYLPFGTYSATLRMLPTVPAFAIAAALYVIGVFGDSYYVLTKGLPPVRAMYDFFSGIFSYTRNGLFFAPLYILLGNALAKHRLDRNRFGAGIGLAVSLALMTVEGLLLKGIAFATHDNMFFSLIPATIFLFDFLASFKVKPRPRYRKAAMWIYILHPIAGYWIGVLAVRLGIDNFSARYSFMNFVLVTVLSFAAAFGIELARAAFGRLRRQTVEQ